MKHLGAVYIAGILGILGLDAALRSYATAANPPVCEATEQGMRADSSDNVEALRRALSACAGRTIHIARGKYNFGHQGFQTGLKIPANTTIVGDGIEGASATVLRVADNANFDALLWIRNVSGITIHGLRFEGSGYESGCERQLDYGHAIYIESDAGQTASVEGVSIHGNAFSDFNGQSWLTINSQPQSAGIGIASQIVISENIFRSDRQLRGGCSKTGGIAYPTAMVWLHGSNLSATGLVSNVSIQSNTFEAGFVKGAVAVWSGTRKIAIEHNAMRDVGRNLLPQPEPEQGMYAILIYNSAYQGTQDLPGLHPDQISVIDNDINNPVSCGVYVAKGRNVKIVHNRISGQTDQFDDILPKGAISLNHAEATATVDDNDLDNNYIGISSVASILRLGTNHIRTAAHGLPTKIS